MNDRLQIAAMCLQGLLSVENGETYESKVGDAIFCADALLAECGEGEAAQPRKVEVTEEKANAIYSLCSQIMKEPIEMYWFCERLSDIINGGDV